ncbi:MAG: thioesterase family protein [Cellulomonadaceae bacterium]|jgi:acyl-CoA thioesterase-2|nr:thioesterase family protein [Cellulomonadaceae bacterium]
MSLDFDAATVDPLDRLLGVLDLAPGDVDRREELRHRIDSLWHGTSVPAPSGTRIYGGQVLAQALLAAGRTVAADRLPHSLHGYFLRPGTTERPVDFAVEHLHDGRSFSARRVHAVQNGQPILSISASFQEHQPGYSHAYPMPDNVMAPASATSAYEALAEIEDHPEARWWAADSAFELAHTSHPLFLGPDPERSDRQLVWVRARHHIDSDDMLLHRALLAFACDQLMLEPAVRAAGYSWLDLGDKVKIASLDHAMWWHHNARVDDWLLFVQDAPAAQGGRALGQARVYSRDGLLVASIAQEAMLRLP